MYPQGGILIELIERSKKDIWNGTAFKTVQLQVQLVNDVVNQIEWNWTFSPFYLLVTAFQKR